MRTCLGQAGTCSHPQRSDPGTDLCKVRMIVVMIMMIVIMMMSLNNQGLGYLPGGHLPPPKFGHLPPPNSDISHPQKPNICQEDNCHPQFFSSFFGALFLAFSTYSSWRTSRMGRRRCLKRWSWSTSSRGCVTRWSWSTSSRRCLTSWSWSTSSRGRRWKRSPRW